MGNLIKPADYAKKLGISRQAVYAKIKKGILTSKSVEGKLYIVEQNGETEKTVPRRAETSVAHTMRSQAQQSKNFQELLAAKDETIGVLKETIVDLKDTNQMITSTLRSEVELLKEAFSEMKNIYANQIEHLRPEEPSDAIDLEETPDEFDADVILGAEEEPAPEMDVSETEEENMLLEEGDDLAWIDLEDFFDEHDIRKKARQAKLTKRIKKLFKKGDSRIDSFNGDLILLADAEYSDVIQKDKKRK